ncbi:type II toxin-antitoxin system VapC family toxin [Sphingomonas sp. RS6]
MILVDSSVWIDFLNARETPETRWLKQALPRFSLCTADLVLAEVLQGTRSDRDFDLARDLLTMLDIVTLGGTELAIAAAANYRRLRVQGITIRKTIDALIATYCIRENRPLLFSDRDFQPFVDHLGLIAAIHHPGVN